MNRKVSCPICFEDFGIRQKKIPRFLKECGHTLCSVCISQILVKGPKVPCPTCRVETPGKYLSDYQKNFALLEFLSESGPLHWEYKPSVEDQQEDDEFLKQEEMKKQADEYKKQQELERKRARALALERKREMEEIAAVLERSKREAEEEAYRRKREEEEMARAIYESEQAMEAKNNKAREAEARRIKQEQELRKEEEEFKASRDGFENAQIEEWLQRVQTHEATFQRLRGEMRRLKEMSKRKDEPIHKKEQRLSKELKRLSVELERRKKEMMEEERIDALAAEQMKKLLEAQKEQVNKENEQIASR